MLFTVTPTGLGVRNAILDICINKAFDPNNYNKLK